MNATVQFVDVERRPSVEALLMKKLKNLFKKYDWILKADVFYKREKGSVGKGKI